MTVSLEAQERAKVIVKDALNIRFQGEDSAMAEPGRVDIFPSFPRKRETGTLK